MEKKDQKPTDVQLSDSPSETPDPSESPEPSESPDPSESPEPSESPKPSKSPSPPQSVSGTPAQQTGDVTIQLQGQNGFNQSGTVTFKSISSNTVRVDVNVASLGTAAQPAHIHLGTCANPGAVKHALTDVAQGKSRTIINASLIDILSGNLILNIHKSAAEAGAYTSCAPLKI